MGDQLLIRAYNVGCGDCIYVRVPNAGDGFHILIDCGKKGGTELLEKAVRHLKEHALPAGNAPGTKRLDLIVATHRHEDHIKGFDPAWFKGIQVANIWLSAGMDPSHPQAGSARQLHKAARAAVGELSAHGLASSPQLELLAPFYGVSNDKAIETLRDELPKANGIAPRFVSSGMPRKALGLKPGDPVIHVLAPEADIDHYYLGAATAATLNGFSTVREAFRGHSRPVAAALPKNISPSDFRLLQSRLLSNGLAFAEKDTTIQNNLSVVLLIEWRGRRLLFVGDAEWNGEFKKGKQNGSWNVMWEKHRAGHLRAAIDFLKIGHHASHNATPPPGGETTRPGIAQVLDTLLPLPDRGKLPTAQAIVSTEREFYAPIPDCGLLVELARRVRSRRNYLEAIREKGLEPESLWATTKAKANDFYARYEQPHLGRPQPLRTDLEFALYGREFIDVEIPPND